MKKIAYSLFVLSLLMAGVTSCKKYVEGYDISPNAPLVVTPDVLLTGIEVATINSSTGNLARIPGVFVNQLSGRQFQYADYDAYLLRESDVDNDWNQLYTGGLINSQLLIDQAGDANKIYRGIARILKVMNIGLATDLWGDVPYTQALQGLSGETAFNPAYDQQENILRDMQAALDAAITDLGSDPTNTAENLRAPGADDLFFGGDPAKWQNIARVLKARYYNRLSKRDPAGSAQQALAALDAAYANGFDGNDDNMMAPFGESVPEWNPWYGFEQNRGGYIVIDSFFVTLLESTSDPRLPLYVSSDAGNYYEQPIGPYYGGATSPLPLVTFAEAKFIESEAALRIASPDAARAATAYNSAVAASLAQLGVTDADYLAANANESAASITLEKIITQKYIALFTQTEVYDDWRRTGFPVLMSNTGDPIPRRFPTSQNERLYNTNAQVVFDLSQRVWWDQ